MRGLCAVMLAVVVASGCAKDEGEHAMRLLHANANDSGIRGIGADAGPICRSMAATPYPTGKMTYGFADVGSRAYLDLAPGNVVVSIPGSERDRIVANLEEMVAKKAFER